MGKPGRHRALSPVNLGDSATRCVMTGPPLGPRGEDITWPNEVAPRGREASSTRKIKPQTSSHLRALAPWADGFYSRVVIRVATREGFAHPFSTEEGGNQGRRIRPTPLTGAQLHEH